MGSLSQGILYHPLAKEEFRLITIHPQLEDGVLCCSLETFSLNEKTPVYQQFLHSYSSSSTPRRWLISTWASIQRAKVVRRLPATRSMGSFTPTHNCFRFSWGDFAALSYVWGTDHVGKIIVNGQETVVTKNLEEALRELRADKGRFTDKYKLWETAEQVSRMREIYSQAWAVIAWLGPAADDTDQGMHLLCGLARLNNEEKDELSASLETDPTQFGDSAFYGLNSLMKRPYWSRLWIIQELCGGHTLDWSTFSRGISTLYHGGIWAAKDWLLKSEIKTKAASLDPRWATASIHLVHQDLRPLSKYELAKSESREEKDKVFGLVGMMDPAISTAEIFRATTVAFIEHYGNLEPLREANVWGSAHTALRYSKPESVFIGPFWTPGTPEPRPETIYCADGQTRPQYSLAAEGQLLQCQGVVIDTICGLGACKRGRFDWDTATVVQPETWTSIYSDTAKALCSALLLGRVSNGEHVSERHSALLNLPRTYESAFDQFEALGWPWLKDQEAYYSRWVGWNQAHGNIKMGGQYMGDYFTDVIPEGASEFDYAEVFLAADRSGMGRRLMFTQKGYLGWAPDNTHGSLEDQVQAGDMICLIFGCSTPLVIRPAGDNFLVLGEAYVEGMMDGEATQLLERGEMVEQGLVFV
ncbi:heterokaryon incompatibility protein-domain-containing protein [Dactylonectria estremocensis]|uniref:Heterokaryon incompatibility protein-domain-containing protein n=1 Tax=Dactylonectria estremocensis TaxID=1079267 RepID=A0A9P9F7D8_9HYPO|nr:heterokaryon incompatibility protein-domain-containing protein [Dactylonectria estremocensis]